MSDDQLTSAEKATLVAIVITVLVHFALMFGLDTYKMGTGQAHLSQVTLMIEEEKIEDNTPSQLQQDLAEIRQTLNLQSNQASNVRSQSTTETRKAKKGSLNKEYMSSLPQEDFFSDKHITRSKKKNKKYADEPVKEMGTEADKNINAKRNSSVVYDVKGRIGLHLESPVYLCDGSAVVMVSIWVTPFGSVSKAEVATNSTQNTCASQTAIRYARKSRFSKASETTQGTITYTFVR